MTPEQIEARVRSLIEDGIGNGNLAVMEELVSPDCIEHQRGLRPGLEGIKELSAVLHRWMTDFELRVEDAVVAGDRVWLRNRARGISTGSVMGLPPSGTTVEVDVFDLVRVEDGRVVEHWGVADQLGLLLQLGFDPRRSAAGAAAAAV